MKIKHAQYREQEVAEHYGAPPVKPGQVEAIKLVQEIAAEPKVRFDVRLQPGTFTFFPFAKPGTFLNATALAVRSFVHDLQSPHNRFLDPTVSEGIC